MGEQSTHKISVCISCRATGAPDDDVSRPGRRLLDGLRSALTWVEGQDFEVAAINCMAGCERPCTVAYTAQNKATYLFGDIDTDRDVDDLVAFAQQYAQLADGWCSSTTRPAGLANKTLARVPAAVLDVSGDSTDGPIQ